MRRPAHPERLLEPVTAERRGVMLEETDWALRGAIYAGLAATGAVPEPDELADGATVDLRIVDGELAGETDAYVHFAVPARRWWDDIVET